MKYSYLVIAVLFLNLLKGQDIAVYQDDRYQLFVFENNRIKKIEFTPVYRYYFGRDYVVYVNNLFEFKLYHKGIKYTILPRSPDTVIANDYLLGYIQAGQLGIFDGKVSKALQNFVGKSFSLGDSLFVYLDNFNMLQAYSNDNKILIEKWVPENFIFWGADNIFAYLSMQEELILLDAVGNKEIIENYKPKEVKIGRNILAYNDYIGSFKIWNFNQLETVENYYVQGLQAGNDFAVYFTNLNIFMGYYRGVKTELLPFKPSTYIIKRNLMAYTDNANNFYLFYQGKKIKLENYTPKKYLIDDDIIVYQDINGRLKGVINGRQVIITDQIVVDFELCNKSVVFYDLTPSDKKVWSNGDIFTMIVETREKKLNEQKY